MRGPGFDEFIRTTRIGRCGSHQTLAVLLVALSACSSTDNEGTASSVRGTAGVRASEPATSAGIVGRTMTAPSTPPASTNGNPNILPISSGANAGRGAGGGSADEPASCASVGAAAQARRLPSDIVWAIDTSGSMSSSFPSIQQALVDFSAEVVAAGIDAHIVLLAGSGLCVPPPLGSGMCGAPSVVPFPIPTQGPPKPAPDTKLPNFVHLDVQFGANDGMRVLLDSFAQYKDQLRPNARTQLVLTEDGGPLVTPDAVRGHIEGKQAATATPAWNPPLQPGHYVWNGVVCSNGRGVAGCSDGFGAAPTTALELIKSTGGVLGDLEQAGKAGQDPFGPLLKELAQAVIEGSMLSCEYEIPPAPQGEKFDRDRVNVVYMPGKGGMTTYPRFDAIDQCMKRPGWAYDDPANPKRVLLCPEACNAVQQDATGRMRVEFGCATVIAVPD